MIAIFAVALPPGTPRRLATSNDMRRMVVRLQGYLGRGFKLSGDFAMNRSAIGLAVALLLNAGAVSAAGQAPNDAQISAIVVAANQVDIDAGRLAVSKASSAKVKDFAQLMVTDHSDVNEAATKLVSKLQVTPEPNDTSESLKKGGHEKLASLRQLGGSAFDLAYVDNEVAYHQAVLEALDKTLIPNASNAELKALLVKVRPAFVAHLDHAKQLQSALRRSGE